MASATLQIRLANCDDKETIDASFNQHFLRDEPMNIYLKDYKSKDTIPDNVPDHGLTLVAEFVHPEYGVKFAGFLMCEICHRSRTKDEDNIVIRKDNQAGDFIFQILRELDQRFDVFARYKITQAVDLVILSVVPQYRGKSVGLKLCREAINIAVSKGTDLVFMDCTSSFSALIASKLDMECIGEISYEEFQNKYEIKLFETSQQQTHIRRFVKVFENN